MKFCCHCGHTLTTQTPTDDDRARKVCIQCDSIHYQNPKCVVGCLALHNEKVLLCRRGISPSKGLWTLPAGYLENGETALEGAQRETLEEASVHVDIHQLYRLYNITRINEVYLIYLAKLQSTHIFAGAETQEVKMFSFEDLPWNEMAFSIVGDALRDYIRDKDHQQFLFEEIDVASKPLPDTRFKNTLTTTA